MKIQNILFLLFLLCLQNLSANNPTYRFNLPRLVFSSEIDCNLPAPSALNVDAIGPDWVDVSWPLVSGASQYRLQAFNATNGDPLDVPVFVSGTTSSATVSTAGNDGTAYVRIWSVCSNGEFNWDAYMQSVTFDTIIIDVVVTGFNLPNGYCPFQPVGVTIENFVWIPWNGSKEYFQVKYSVNGDLLERNFELLVKNIPDPDHVQISILGDPNGREPGNDNEKIVFDRLIEEGNPVRLLIRYRANPATTRVQDATIIAELEASAATPNQGKFYKKGPLTNPNNDPNCYVNKYIPCSQSLTEGSSSNEESYSSNLEERNAVTQAHTPLSARPNPFRDAITVQLPEAGAENARMMHLYDLLGARRMSYQVPANQTECTLNTSLLTPGVYFLHIEADGKMETIKLLKTQ